MINEYLWINQEFFKVLTLCSLMFCCWVRFYLLTPIFLRVTCNSNHSVMLLLNNFVATGTGAVTRGMSCLVIRSINVHSGNPHFCFCPHFHDLLRGWVVKDSHIKFSQITSPWLKSHIELIITFFLFIQG